MIGISTIIIDPDGARYFERRELAMSSVLGNRSGSRRVSRTATLDGGCTVTDAGYAVADKTIRIECPNPSIEIVEFMAYIVQNYNTVLVCTEEGAFTGNPERFEVSEKAAQLTILITGET
jgi:hypothetical protein